MSQHDFDIATADANTGVTFRAAVNAALQALASCSSGASEPTTTYAYQLWADTTAGMLKLRDATNTLWMTMCPLAGLTQLAPLSNPTFTGDVAAPRLKSNVMVLGASAPKAGTAWNTYHRTLEIEGYRTTYKNMTLYNGYISPSGSGASDYTIKAISTGYVIKQEFDPAENAIKFFISTASVSADAVPTFNTSFSLGIYPEDGTYLAGISSDNVSSKGFQTDTGYTRIGSLKLSGSLVDYLRFYLPGDRNYANNAAALAAGLVAGDVYRNGDVLMIVH